MYALARYAFGEQAGRIAGVMAALCGSLLYFEGELLAVPVEVFLNLLLLYGLLLAWRRDRGRDWVLAGLIAGLAALTRPTILLFIAAFCGLDAMAPAHLCLPSPVLFYRSHSAGHLASHLSQLDH